MSEKAKISSCECNLPNREPQAPRSISIEQADKDSSIGRNNIPYNKGSEGHAFNGSTVDAPGE